MRRGPARPRPRLRRIRAAKSEVASRGSREEGEYTVTQIEKMVEKGKNSVAVSPKGKVRAGRAPAREGAAEC